MNVYLGKNGRMYEFSGINKKFLFFLLRRFIASLIDFIIIVGIIFGTTIYIPNMFTKYLIGSILGMAFASTYNLIAMYFLSGQTIGMKISGIITTNYYGQKPTKFRLLMKAFIMGMYFFPFIGFGILLSSLITPILMRGLTLINVWTKTSIITVKLYNAMIEEENKILKNERDKNGK